MSAIGLRLDNLLCFEGAVSDPDDIPTDPDTDGDGLEDGEDPASLVPDNRNDTGEGTKGGGCYPGNPDNGAILLLAICSLLFVCRSNHRRVFSRS